jgi:putative membrane protein
MPSGHAYAPATAVPSSTDLAALRTVLASDRTLMAWVRTWLSLLSFGFTMYKVLEGLVADGRAISPIMPRNAGLVLAFAGTMSMAMGILQSRYTQSLVRWHVSFRPRRLSLLMALMMCITGIALFFSIAMHFI